MIERTDIERIVGASVRDREGGDLGVVRLVYADHDSGRPEWAVVTGSGAERFVPLFPSTYADGEIVVPVSSAAVSASPGFDPDAGHLSGDDEAELYAHYGYAPDGTALVEPEAADDSDAADKPAIGESDAEDAHPAEVIALDTDIEASQGYLTEEQRDERADARTSVAGRHRRDATDIGSGPGEG